MIFRPGDYRPHQRFYAAADPRIELWRTVLGSVTIAAVYIGLLVGFLFIVRLRYGPMIGSVIYAAMLRGATPGTMVLLLLTFLSLAIGAVTATRLVHGRRGGTLFGDGRQVVGDFWRVAVAVFALNLGLLPFALTQEGVQSHLDLGTFVTYLPFALIALVVQTGAEELVFRGYLQQQLAARFRSPWVWMLVPSLLFASMHYSPAYGPNAWLIVAWATLFGLCAADLTARTGSLGAAIGLHFSTNLAAFFFVGIGGNLDGMALWSQAIDLGNAQMVRPLLLVDFFGIITSWLLARLTLRV